MDKKKKDTKADKNVEKINELESRVEELENNWKRALADYKNLEKRSTEEKQNIVEFSNSVLIENLLPVLDNFKMIEEHSTDDGIKFSIKEFKNVLVDSGLKEIEIKPGDTFDTKTMDAIETEKGDKNKVTQILRKGYLFKGKLIRPVSVKVGNGESNAETQKGEK